MRRSASRRSPGAARRCAGSQRCRLLQRRAGRAVRRGDLPPDAKCRARAARRAAQPACPVRQCAGAGRSQPRPPPRPRRVRPSAGAGASPGGQGPRRDRAERSHRAEPADENCGAAAARRGDDRCAAQAQLLRNRTHDRANPHARISEAGFARLVSGINGDKSLAAVLAVRTDICSRFSPPCCRNSAAAAGPPHLHGSIARRAADKAGKASRMNARAERPRGRGVIDCAP